MNSTSAPRRRVQVLFAVLLLLGLPATAFVLLEGGSSLVLLLRDLTASRGEKLAEHISTEYDADLGWIARRNAAFPDMYGPGVSLHTNARGFRGRTEVADARPAGKTRIVCLGDSFTLGYGVADDDTWCARLSSPVSETINMGQGGYGIDQAYLWYRRDARDLQHDALVLGVITDDFRRMTTSRFVDYRKPLLRVVADTLAVTATPVPRASGQSFGTRVSQATSTLRLAELARRLLPDRAAGDASNTTTKSEVSMDEVRRVLALLLADLARIGEAKQSRLVVAYFPVETDYVNESSLPWRTALRSMSDSLPFTFVDLVPELRRFPRDTVRTFYIQRDVITFMAAKGHFTPRGNAWVADHLERALVRLGAMSPRSGGASPAPRTASLLSPVRPRPLP